MAETWVTVKAGEVHPGDYVRHRDSEFVVARVEDPFLGLDSMIALIEDNPERWHKYPAARDADVEVRRPAA
jgi:hypothetical protein